MHTIRTVVSAVPSATRVPAGERPTSQAMSMKAARGVLLRITAVKSARLHDGRPAAVMSKPWTLPASWHAS